MMTEGFEEKTVNVKYLQILHIIIHSYMLTCYDSMTT